MPRARRYYILGYIWHITHRCHKKEFLLKFALDRRRWLEWLFEAKKRYGLRILNYIVTSNHIHLLVIDSGERDAIPKSMQLIAGRTGQEYNQRKKRKGGYWEDRYHATAVEKSTHFLRCMVYIDMNMVRASVINYPSEWGFSGYNEIQNPRQRYALIDYKELMNLFKIKEVAELTSFYKRMIDDALKSGNNIRESKWTDSIAVSRRDAGKAWYIIKRRQGY